jgi:hypothetical protein
MSTGSQREPEELYRYAGQYESDAPTGRWQQCDGANHNRPSRNQQE